MSAAEPIAPRDSAPSPPRPSTGRSSSRDLAIDGMRGVAILLVVAYHAGPLSWRLAPYDPSGQLVWPALGAWWLAVPFLHFGYMGVHLFFVISGFCIHASARRGRDLFPVATDESGDELPARLGAIDRAGLTRFALRRLIRIAPPYWIALALFGLVVPLVAAAIGRGASFPGGPAPAWDLGAHALFLHGFFQRSIFSIDPAFWSLATEMHFYVTYPLVAWAMLRWGAGRVLLGALLVSLGWRAAVLAAWAPTVEHFMIYRVWLHGFFVPRWFEWILGCALAEALAPGASIHRARWRHAARGGLVLLVGGMLCRVHVVIDKLFADALLSTGFALLLGALLAAERAPATVATVTTLTSGPRRLLHGLGGGAAWLLALVGRRSYGTYLVHQPILDGEWLPLGPRLALAAAVSALFSLGCERPFERLAQRAGRRPSAPAVVEPQQGG